MRTEAAILDATLRLLATRGIQGTSLDAVAEEVGVAKSSILWHFGSKEELLLRVAAILRRSTWYQASGAALEFGGNRIDFATYEARAWDGTEHALTHKEAMILRVLADQPGHIVTREEILDRVWGYEVFPSTRTIDNFIVRLRKRFERNPESPLHFHTVRGVGYRFTPEPETQAERADHGDAG